MKTFIFLIACFFAVTAKTQNSIAFGKRQLYVCARNEKEVPLNKQIVEMYGNLYNDTLEIPLNRCFANDSMTVFIGVSFKYSFDELYGILTGTGQNIWDELHTGQQYFYAQNNYKGSVISRYVYYSKIDGLLYVVNFVFALNKPFLKPFFQDILASIKNK